MLVDSHCHLQDPKFRGHEVEVIQRARDGGVGAMVVVGYDMPSSQRAVELADEHEDLYAVIGVHPHDAKALSAKDVDTLERMADSAKVVAIGEIGLDFYRNLSPQETQYRALQEQLKLAETLRLPVVIHSRDADEQCYEVLAQYAYEAKLTWPKDRAIGIMHCYAGDLMLALRYIELGFAISIAGTVTYPNAQKTRAVACGIPLRWMAVETDAPYLTPQSRRGQRNEPAYVRETVDFIAECRGESMDEVADKTALTAAWLFGLGNIDVPAASGEAR